VSPAPIDINAATMAPTINPGADPAGFVRRVVALLDTLGLPGELARSRELLEHSENLTETARRGKRAAEQRWEAEQRRLLEPGPVEVERLEAAQNKARPWLDSQVEQGRAAAMMAALMGAAEECRGRALAQVNGEATGVHARLQTIAAEVVAHVASLPPLPRQVWSAPAREAATIAIQERHEQTWAALVQDGTRFHTCHQVAELLWATGGLGVWVVPGCRQGIGVLWRRWERAEEGYQRFRQVAGPLRLPFAIREGWEPGLWLPSDLTNRPAEAERPGLLARALAFGRAS
jgi:hypothetical protein